MSNEAKCTSFLLGPWEREDMSDSDDFEDDGPARRKARAPNPVWERFNTLTYEEKCTIFGDYVSKKEYPEWLRGKGTADKNARSNLRKMVKGYRLNKDGCLWYNHKRSDDDGKCRSTKDFLFQIEMHTVHQFVVPRNFVVVPRKFVVPRNNI